jgi:hypothetical protein
VSWHHYPVAALARDYLRATAGLILAAMPIMFVQPIPVIQYVLGAIATLFAFFGIRTLLRQLTRVELTGAGIRTGGPLGSAIAWDDLTSVELRYYSTRRDQQRGWLQLKLRSVHRRLAFDSTLSDFISVARRAIAEAQSRGHALGPATLSNLDMIGGASQQPKSGA